MNGELHTSRTEAGRAGAGLPPTSPPAADEWRGDPDPSPVRYLVRQHRVHAPPAEYATWLGERFDGRALHERVAVYEMVTANWANLDRWFAAPPDHWCGPAGAKRAGALTYLAYLSLVCGVELPYSMIFGGDVNLADVGLRPGQLGADGRAIKRCARVLARTQGMHRGSARCIVGWALGAVLLHRGTPEVSTVQRADLNLLAWSAFRWCRLRGMAMVPVGTPLPGDGWARAMAPSDSPIHVLVGRARITLLALEALGQVGPDDPPWDGRDLDPELY